MSERPPPSPPTARQLDARRYWDERAQRDPLFAIWGDPAVGGGGPVDTEAFVRSGEEAARVVLPFVRADSVVLEIGCGIGRIVRALAPHCREVIGLDVSPRMVEQAHVLLAGVPNARVLQGDGATLEAVGDASVDVVYSLLCLIHADKRSAFRYLREIRRVLTPGGRAILQFQDGTSARGHALFAGVAELEYPFEFYAPDELRLLLRSAGLVVEEERRHGEFIEVVVARGEPSAAVTDPLGGFAAEDVRREGCFADGGGALQDGGAVSAVLVNAVEVTRICDVSATLVSVDGETPLECFHLSGALFVPAQSRTPLRLELRDATSGLVLVSDAPFARFAHRTSPEASRARRLEARLSLVPHGFRPPDATLRWLPAVGARWTIELG